MIIRSLVHKADWPYHGKIMAPMLSNDSNWHRDKQSLDLIVHKSTEHKEHLYIT